MSEFAIANPQEPYLLYHQANTYFAQDQFDAARELYQKLLLIHKICPIQTKLLADVYHNLGMIAEGRQSLDAAIHYYRMAVKIDRDRSMTWIFLAKLYLDRFQQNRSLGDITAGKNAIHQAERKGTGYPIIPLLKTQYQTMVAPPR